MSIIIAIIGKDKVMRFLTVTELKQRATEIISDIESTKEEVVITKKGKPVALIQSISNNAFALKEKGKEGDKNARGREPGRKGPRGREAQAKGTQGHLQKR